MKAWGRTDGGRPLGGHVPGAEQPQCEGKRKCGWEGSRTGTPASLAALRWTPVKEGTSMLSLVALASGCSWSPCFLIPTRIFRRGN